MRPWGFIYYPQFVFLAFDGINRLSWGQTPLPTDKSSTAWSHNNMQTNAYSARIEAFTQLTSVLVVREAVRTRLFTQYSRTLDDCNKRNTNPQIITQVIFVIYCCWLEIIIVGLLLGYYYRCFSRSLNNRKTKLTLHYSILVADLVAVSQTSCFISTCQIVASGNRFIAWKLLLQWIEL